VTLDMKNRIIRIDAKPEPIAMDSAKTAVTVVDMQNDFAAKAASSIALELIFLALKRLSARPRKSWPPRAVPE
jgi:nicotinamidase-related amidase